MDVRRLFVSVSLDKTFTKALAKYRDAHRKIPYLRWVPIENFHITLLFIGMVPEFRMSEIEDALDAVAQKHRSFSLTCTGINYAPPGELKSMVWAYFEHPRSFITLIEHVAEEVRGVIEPQDSLVQGVRNHVQAHATLARFRRRVPAKDHIRLRHSEVIGRELKVERMALMESISGPNGPRYRVLREFSFMGPASKIDKQ